MTLSLLARASRWLIPPLDAVATREARRFMHPLAFGMVVWGIVTGVGMVNSGLSTGWSLALTITAYAGSAQLAVAPLLADQVPLPIVWITALLVNVRFAIFAAAMRGHVSQLPLRQRLFASFANGDLIFILLGRRFGDPPEKGTTEQLSWFYTLVGYNYLLWQGGCIAGILLGDVAPTEWGLGLAAVLALLAVLIPMLVSKPIVAGVLTTGVVSLAAAKLPLRLGVILSILVGMLVAAIVDRSGTTEREHEGGTA
jgi:predicted branched-subunit amino acid permease